jgi:hypothetical protein
MENKKPKYKTFPMIYSGQVALAASSSGQLPFTIASNFMFKLCAFTYKTSVNQANIIPTFDIQILKNELALFTDYTPNEFFTGLAVETSTTPDTRYIIGQGEWFKFSVPFLFENSSNIVVNLRDTCGYANTVRIGLAGYKLVYFS